MSRRHEYDLICIGSGPAGQRAAIQAAKLGKKTVVIEKQQCIGGVCIETGTIPSKTFREAVRRLYSLNGARKLRRSFGLMKKQWFTDTIQLRNRCPLRQSTSHLPAAYPRIDLASLVQMDPQRLGITGRLSLASHR
jgi:pyruvate/2-oxoglutarate dehydrogenase complex dihydrolipoamide dehydrogenase (E3) component